MHACAHLSRGQYRVKSEADLPPSEGWTIAKDGAAPMPTISAYYPMPSPLTPPAAGGLVGEAVAPTAIAVPLAQEVHMPVVMGMTVVTSWTVAGAPDGGWANAATTATPVDTTSTTLSLKQKCELIGSELALL